MSTKRPRPVITIVEARPMSEIGFRSEQSAPPLSATDKPSSPDSISAVRHSSDSSSSVSLNRSANRPARPAPVRPQHNIQGFDTSSTGHAFPPEPKHSAPAPGAVPVAVPREVRHSPPEQRRRPSPDAESIESGSRTTGEPRPVPRPRPRSMIVKPPRQFPADNQPPPPAAEKQAKPTRPTIIRRSADDFRPSTVMNVDSEGQGKSVMSASRSMDFDHSTKVDKPLPAIPAKPKPSRTFPDEDLTSVRDIQPPQMPVDGTGSRRKPTIIRASVAGTGMASQPTSSVDAPTLPLRPAATVAPKVSDAAQPSEDRKKATQPAVFLHDGSASFHADGAHAKPVAEKAESSSVKPSSRQHPESTTHQKPPVERLSKTTTWYTDDSFVSKKSPEDNVSKAEAPFHALRKTVPAVAHPAVKASSADAANPPQPKKRPTIIRTEKQPLDAAAADGSNLKQEMEPCRATGASVANGDEGSVARTPTTTSPELENLRNHSLETTHGTVEMTRTTQSASQIRTPVPRARQPQQHVDNAPKVVVQEPAKKQGPSKPPPPRSAATPKVEEPVHAKESAGIAVEATRHQEGRPPLPVVGRSQHQPPARPSVPPVSSFQGSPPSLPHRPTLGHPLYHYVVKGPHALALFDFVATQHDELSFKAGEIIALEKWISAEWMVGSTGHGQGMFPVNFVEIVEPLPAGLNTSVAPQQSEENGAAAAATSHTSPEIRPPADPAPLPSVSGPHCIARFDYEAGEPGDLEFVSGDIIRLVERVGVDWLRGELHGKTGIFPLAFVEILEDLPAEASVKADDSPVSANSWPPSSPVKTNLAPLPPLKTDVQPPSPAAKAATLPRLSPTKTKSVADSPVASPRKVVEDDGQPYCIAAFEFEGETAEDLNFQVGDRILLIGRINAEWLRGKLEGREGIFPEAFVNIIRDIDNDLPPRPKVSIPPLYPTHQTPSSGPSSPARNYPTHVATSPAATSSAPSPLRAVALYDYDGDVSAGDLCFKAGETIEDVQSISTDWMSGRIGQKTGHFPMAFVQIS